MRYLIEPDVTITSKRNYGVLYVTTFVILVNIIYHIYWYYIYEHFYFQHDYITMIIFIIVKFVTVMMMMMMMMMMMIMRWWWWWWCDDDDDEWACNMRLSNIDITSHVLINSSMKPACQVVISTSTIPAVTTGIVQGTDQIWHSIQLPPYQAGLSPVKNILDHICSFVCTSRWLIMVRNTTVVVT